MVIKDDRRPNNENEKKSMLSMLCRNNNAGQGAWLISMWSWWRSSRDFSTAIDDFTRDEFRSVGCALEFPDACGWMWCGLTNARGGVKLFV